MNAMFALRRSYLFPMVLLALSGFQMIRLFQDEFLDVQGTPFGVLKARTGDVKRKPSDRFRWFETRDQDALFSGESIRTAKDGRATLQLGDHGQWGELELGEQSLVVLSHVPGNPSQPRIQLQRGRLKVRRLKGAQIQVAQKVYQPHATHSGSAELVARPDAALAVDRKGVLTEHPVEAMPPPSSIPNDSVSSDAISQDPAPQATIPPTPVAAPPTASAPLIQAQRPVHIRPDPSGTRDSTRLGPSGELNTMALRLRWKPVDQVEHYQLELFRGADTVPFARTQVAQPFYTYIVKSPRDLTTEYLVSATLPDGKRISSLRQGLSVDWASPVPVRPLDHAMVTAQHLGASGELLFTWEKTLFAERYDFQLSNDPSFKHFLHSFDVRENFTSLKLPRGEFYWRVRSRGGSRKSAWSSPRHLVLRGGTAVGVSGTEPSPPATLAPPDALGLNS